MRRLLRQACKWQAVTFFPFSRTTRRYVYLLSTNTTWIDSRLPPFSTPFPGGGPFSCSGNYTFRIWQIVPSEFRPSSHCWSVLNCIVHRIFSWKVFFLGETESPQSGYQQKKRGAGQSSGRITSNNASGYASTSSRSYTNSQTGSSKITSAVFFTNP